MAITTKQLQKVFGAKIDDELTTGINAALDSYNIKTPEQVASFLAQVGTESDGFTAMVENLNYSAQGLIKTFGSHFTVDLANSCARNPEKIANIAYANRMGNGDPSTGDGWKFRGRGYIQLTGESNYIAYSKSINKSIDDTIKFLETKAGAIDSAAWFWQQKSLNKCAEDVIVTTRKINGGLNGIEKRTDYFNQLKKILTVK
ncbi:MAG: glycoside hydrolase family 19 protein [Pseudomonadota bacterium]|nr:glycoside hydrolase family 19 protein [Pseudomonadota bacterium]